MFNDPLAYFLTFTVYGSWLLGDARGSYRRNGTFVDPNAEIVERERKRLQAEVEIFSARERETVAAAFCDLCSANDWRLFALSVRSNHVHILLDAAPTPPKTVAARLKARATLWLRRREGWPESRPVWTKGESARYVFTENDLEIKNRYINNQ